MPPVPAVTPAQIECAGDDAETASAKVTSCAAAGAEYTATRAATASSVRVPATAGRKVRRVAGRESGRSDFGGVAGITRTLLLRERTSSTVSFAWIMPFLLCAVRARFSPSPNGLSPLRAAARATRHP